jgi:hypothetical protein
MVYARVFDQTLADDYFTAKEKIEQLLKLPSSVLIQPPSTSEMLTIVDQLFSNT